MFMKNGNFELVYTLTVATVYRCHRGIMLIDFVFSGNGVKCVLKCRPSSLVFSTLWNCVPLPGCECGEWSSFLGP